MKTMRSIANAISFSLILAALILSLPPSAQSIDIPLISTSTNVSGIISSDTTWTVELSPYIVTGNVMVSNGATLTIEPGVSVRFDNGKSLQVNGTLIAKGTPTNKITFTSNQPSPAPGDWGYLLFTDTSVDATFDADGNYIGGSILEHCIVEYAGWAADDNHAIKTDQAAPFLNYLLVQNNKGDGIYDTGSSILIPKASLRIANSVISNNESKGFYFSGRSGESGEVNISYSLISNNGGDGVYIRAGSEVTLNVQYNIIKNNKGGIEIDALHPIDWTDVLE